MRSIIKNSIKSQIATKHNSHPYPTQHLNRSEMAKNIKDNLAKSIENNPILNDCKDVLDGIVKKDFKSSLIGSGILAVSAATPNLL